MKTEYRIPTALLVLPYVLDVLATSQEPSSPDIPGGDNPDIPSPVNPDPAAPDLDWE